MKDAIPPAGRRAAASAGRSGQGWLALLCIGAATVGGTGCVAPPAAEATGAAAAAQVLPARQAEYLDRGAVVLPTAGGQLITWRALAHDAPGLLFHVERDGKRITLQPQALTQFVDTAALPAGSAPQYRITAIAADGRSAAAEPALWLPEGALRLPLQVPPPHVGADGVPVPYEANDGAPADLDGDGRYEIVLKWQPANAKDNSQPGHTAPTLIDAYKLDGTRLWRIDLGPNIRSGAHYTPFTVFDFDGDGRAELMLRTADGTLDGTGRVLGQRGVDHRNERGYVLRGDEFISVFDGRSGALRASVPYTPPRGDVGAWGDSYGNRVDRFLAGVAYLDGRRPSAVFSRGYYTRAVHGGLGLARRPVARSAGCMTARWPMARPVCPAPATPRAAARLRAGCTLVLPSAMWTATAATTSCTARPPLAASGQLLYSTGLGHGDALHVGPARPHTGRAAGVHGARKREAATVNTASRSTTPPRARCCVAHSGHERRHRPRAVPGHRCCTRRAPSAGPRWVACTARVAN